MTDLIIVGASGLGREVLQMIRDINELHDIYNVLGFIDDDLNALDDYECGGIRVLGRISEWKPLGGEKYAFAIANPKNKEKIVKDLINQGCEFETIIHPLATIKDFTKIGKGVIIFERAGISVNAEIGDFVFINCDVRIGHDAKIGDFCSMMPKCNISGKTVMGKCVMIGTLASTFQGIKVGDYATVGMNSAAVKDVKAGATVMGVPAQRIF